jgi:hypothetical protein
MAREPLTSRAAWGLVAAAALALLSAALPFGRELGAEWRRHQRAWAQVSGRPAPGVREVAPWGAPERCPTCHLGMDRPAERGVGAGGGSADTRSVPSIDDQASAGRPRPLAPHPPILAQHALERDGCVACHGGAGRALDRGAAHPKDGPEELRRGPLVAAGCPRCHAPGSVPGDRLVVDGIFTFVDLGCISCHRAGRVDATSEFGPDLSAIGLRGSAYLRRVTKEPGKLFPGTKMPDFTPVLADKGREEALLAYLLSLRGEARRRPARDAQAALPCGACHVGGAPQGAPHRCVFILERKAELGCARCHPAGAPRTGRECPYVLKHRFICGACHEAGRG